ncbi:unnamed protein product [Pseudo-nitzschia multistriata]|uniref:Thioredoxin domain-containing protein n=1 Tax=Pseudo-nitzschia multistriata TaxID=183589 RepID=A0A448Z213_9STRA|nr:unnamed protein product [Pseudo-nitzschia multistriata]
MIFVATAISDGPHPKWFAQAFSVGRTSHARASARRRGSTSIRPSVLAASRPDGDNASTNEWVSYFEEVFNNSNSDLGEDDDHRGSAGSNGRTGEKEAVGFQTPVTTYANALDLLDAIDGAPPDDLTAVLFFAHYCKTCHRANIPFKQLAYEHGGSGSGSDSDSDANGSGVRFLRFETSSLSPNQFRSLGLERVPFLQIYRRGVCVASFSATKATGPTTTKMVLRSRLSEHLEACKRRSDADWSAFRRRYAGDIEANASARRRLRAELVAGGGIDADMDMDMDMGMDIDTDPGTGASQATKHERLYRSVRTLTSEAELLDLVVGDTNDSGDETLVVMFHSHFDPSCLRAQHKFRKIADERRQKHQQQDTPMASRCRMVRIESSLLSDETLNHLGIRRYPHIQIYRGAPDFGGRVTSGDVHHARTRAKECAASFSVPRSFLFGKMLHESLDAIDERTPEEWEKFYEQHGDEIEAQQAGLERIVRKTSKRHDRPGQ